MQIYAYVAPAPKQSPCARTNLQMSLRPSNLMEIAATGPSQPCCFMPTCMATSGGKFAKCLCMLKESTFPQWRNRILTILQGWRLNVFRVLSGTQMTDLLFLDCKYLQILFRNQLHSSKALVTAHNHPEDIMPSGCFLVQNLLQLPWASQQQSYRSTTLPWYAANVLLPNIPDSTQSLLTSTLTYSLAE